MNNTFRKYSGLALLPLLLTFSCSDDDNTGHSPLEPSDPAITITVANPNIALTEKDSTFEFLITLSEPQIVDVMVYINVVGGTATVGDDFSIDNGSNRVLIPAYRTSAVASISIKGDVVVDDDVETAIIQIGDSRTANARITPATVEFSITNVTEPDLPLEFAWHTTLLDAEGETVADTDIADMILYITDADGNIVDGADGAAFESLTLPGGADDGVYYVKAGIYASINPGELGSIPNLDLMLTYSQVGKINEATLTFPTAFNANLTCEENIYTMAKIVKTGESYEVTSVGEGPAADVCD